MTEMNDNTATSPIKVLAVDDENLSRQILQKTLEHLGYAVDAASNGKEALAMWHQTKYQIVMTDCQMPLMNGYALAAAIRELEAQLQLPRCTMIALTAHDSLVENQKCLTAGMDSMLAKPVSAEKLQSILKPQAHHASKALSDTNVTQQQPDIINYAILSQVFPDKNRQHLMLSGLEQHLQVALIELNQHIENNNIQGVEAVTHRMKGACKMVGVNAVAVTCHKIEHDAKAGNRPQPAIMDQLHQNIEQFKTFLLHDVKSRTVNRVLDINKKDNGDT